MSDEEFLLVYIRMNKLTLKEAMDAVIRAVHEKNIRDMTREGNAEIARMDAEEWTEPHIG